MNIILSVHSLRVLMGAAWVPLLLLGPAGGASAADVTARLDVDATTAVIPLTSPALGQGIPGYTNHANWYPTPERNDAYLAVNFAVAATAWTEVSCTFVPGASGEARLLLKGPWKKKAEGKGSESIVTAFDGLRCEGATLLNGDFEDQAAGPGEVLKGWLGVVQEGWPRVLEGTAAKAGRLAVAVTHDHPLTQKLALTGGQRVTITAWVKADPQP